MPYVGAFDLPGVEYDPLANQGTRSCAGSGEMWLDMLNSAHGLAEAGQIWPEMLADGEIDEDLFDASMDNFPDNETDRAQHGFTLNPAPWTMDPAP